MIQSHGYAAQKSTTPLAPFSFSRRDPKERDVVVEIEFCGVCHSDIHSTRNEWGNAIYPMVPGHESVLDRHGNTGEWREILASCYRCINAIGLRVGSLWRKRQKSIQFGIAALDAAVKLGSKLACRDFFAEQRGANTRHGPRGGSAHRVITLGTRKNGFSASGAAASTALAISQGRGLSSRNSG